MSRRLRTTEVKRLLAEMERQIRAEPQGGLLLVVDGKPLLVGSHSKDPDAAWGHVRRGFAQGYKLHAIYGTDCLPFQWEVVPLNVAEPEVAARLIPALGKGKGFVLGDSSYDSNPLHDAALTTGRQLLAKRKRPAAGLGHRRHSPGRLRSMALLQTRFGQQLYSQRDQVERHFGWLTNHAAGLAPLPNWVRRLPRVSMWIQAKLLAHAAYVHLTTIPP